jgi:uncharacterized repeat protein (TIGR03803 family)
MLLAAGQSGDHMTRLSYRKILALAAAIAALLPGALPAKAAKEKVLYAFTRPSLGYPGGELLRLNGKLIGAAQGPGDVRGDNNPGQIFELNLLNGTWKEKTIHKFDGTDGANPVGRLAKGPNGVLYGATFAGGLNSCGPGAGCGTLFALTPNGSGWTLSTIWNFAYNGVDGVWPTGDLIVDSSGAIYGTTESGGSSNWGTVFKLALSNGTWAEQILHNFTDVPDGRVPVGGLLMDKSGNLYGTTFWGGAQDRGTVFKLSQSHGTWKETLLYNFAINGTDGEGGPVGPLVADSSGNLYGTVPFGGSDYNGMVYELSKSGKTWIENVLYTFAGGGDGTEPWGALRWSGSGSLYGTTTGTVYELTPSNGTWSFSVLHSFGGSGDGFDSTSGVILDKQGNLYGTTQEGGDTSCGKYKDGCGTVYEIMP